MVAVQKPGYGRLLEYPESDGQPMAETDFHRDEAPLGHPSRKERATLLPMVPPLDKPSDLLPASTPAQEEWMEGFVRFAEEYIGQYPAAFERAPERRALYGDDRERELADLENGTHPLLAHAR